MTAKQIVKRIKEEMRKLPIIKPEVKIDEKGIPYLNYTFVKQEDNK